METPIKMDDLGGKPTIFGNIHMITLLDDPNPPPKKVDSIQPGEPERGTFQDS